MEKFELKNELIEVVSKENEPIYIPFANGEIVNSVMFSEPTEYEILKVEGFESISSGKEATSVDLGFLKTFCVVIKTAKAVKVSVLTLNKK